VASYRDFDRDRWAARRTVVPPELAHPDAPEPHGEVNRLDLLDVYCPLAELVADRAAGRTSGAAPFLVSMVGSVAVGKSTSARALRAMLALEPSHHRTDVVSTDGFLFSNRELAARGLTDRKGFPESFDTGALLRFLDEVRHGQPEVHAPVYSHVLYDVVDSTQVVCRPDVLILEGMPLANEHVDLSIYLDAAESDIEAWFIARFVALCREADRDEASFFRLFAGYTEAQSVATAQGVWEGINSVNLHEHILPARDGSDVILEKGADHAVRRVRLRA
jgi:type I pantothenate kinase